MDVEQKPRTFAEKPISDAQLVQTFLEGDTSAFEEIMTRYRRMVYSVARKMVETHDDADEVTQKTFISAYKNLKNFEGRSQLKTWLFRIAVNYSKNLIRDRGRREGDEITERTSIQEKGADDYMAEADEKRLVHEAVRGLPPRQREVLQLRVQQELSFAEIAEIVGCSVSAAKVNYHYAVKTLRTRMALGKAEAV